MQDHFLEVPFYWNHFSFPQRCCSWYFQRITQWKKYGHRRSWFWHGHWRSLHNKWSLPTSWAYIWMEHYSHHRLYKAKALHSIVLSIPWLLRRCPRIGGESSRDSFLHSYLLTTQPNRCFPPSATPNVSITQGSSSEGIAIWACQSWSLAQSSFLDTLNHRPLSVASSNNHKTFSWYAPRPRSPFSLEWSQR